MTDEHLASAIEFAFVARGKTSERIVIDMLTDQLAALLEEQLKRAQAQQPAPAMWTTTYETPEA
jgi:hypothetical protein